MKFKKSKEGKAINHHLDALQRQFSAYVFVRPSPAISPAKFPKFYPLPCRHYSNRIPAFDRKPCVCDQQGRRKLYRMIKYCFQGKRTLADLVHYAVWNTHLSEKQFVLLGLIEIIKNLRAACPNPGNLV